MLASASGKALGMVSLSLIANIQIHSNGFSLNVNIIVGCIFNRNVTGGYFFAHTRGTETLSSNRFLTKRRGEPRLSSETLNDPGRRHVPFLYLGYENKKSKIALPIFQISQPRCPPSKQKKNAF